MMSDLILFGLLFATYVTMLGATAGGPGPKDLFDLARAFIETLLLLTSSLTFGMALGRAEVPASTAAGCWSGSA